MIRGSRYDSDDWVQSQTRLLRQQFVNAFWQQLDELPINDAKCVFLMSRGLYGRGPAEPTSTDIFNSPAGSTLDTAYRGAGLQSLGKIKFNHHFARAALGGPEGLLHAADLGVDADTIAHMMAQHKKPDGVSQKAYDNSKKLGDLTVNIEDAVRENNLDAGMTAVFGPQWLTFKSTHDPDDAHGHDNP